MSHARSLARRYAVQAIYQWQMNQLDDQAIDLYFVPEKDRRRIDEAYFTELVQQVVRHTADLDQLITPALDRNLTAVDPVELAIIRLGVCEFKHHLDVPFRVVINEAIVLAKLFGSENSHKYINSILDKLAKSLRVTETADKTG
jgi:N utilization substance protein B